MSPENGQPSLDPITVIADKLSVHAKDYVLICTMHNNDFRWSSSTRTYMVGAVRRLLWDLEEQEREEVRQRVNGRST